MSQRHDRGRRAAAAPWILGCAAVVAAAACAGTAGSPQAGAGGAATGGGRATGGGTGSGGVVGTGGATVAGTGGAVAGTGGGSGGEIVIVMGTGGAAGGATGGGSGGAGVGSGGRAGTGGAPGAGGRASDGGVATGGRGGAPDGGTSAASCPASAAICEDFEDGNLDGWTKMESGGTLAIDGTHAASGKNALSISIPANQHGGFIERTGAPLFPLPANLMWGRVMVYFDSVPDGHTDIVRGAPAGGNPPWYNVGEQHGEILLNYYNGSARDCWARPMPGRTIPLRTWMCWEWSFDGAASEMQFFIDGQLSRRVSGMGDGCLNGNFPWMAPQFATARIGAYIAELSSTPVRLWLDDIAIGNQVRVGCPPPP